MNRQLYDQLKVWQANATVGMESGSDVTEWQDGLLKRNLAAIEQQHAQKKLED